MTSRMSVAVLLLVVFPGHVWQGLRGSAFGVPRLSDDDECVGCDFDDAIVAVWPPGGSFIINEGVGVGGACACWRGPESPSFISCQTEDGCSSDVTVSMNGAAFYDPNDLPGQHSCAPVPGGGISSWAAAGCGQPGGGSHVVKFYSSLADCMLEMNHIGVTTLIVKCKACTGTCPEEEEGGEGSDG